MNTRTKRAVAVLVAGLLFALPALAADPPGADAHGVDAHGEAAHESPPLFSVDPGLMIWTIVLAFGLVAVKTGVDEPGAIMRDMEVLGQTLDKDTVMLLTTEGEFTRYLDQSK